MSKRAIIGLILLGIFLFLWFEVRPKVIYSICSRKARNEFNERRDVILKILVNAKPDNFAKTMEEFYQFYFDICLRKYGINP